MNDAIRVFLQRAEVRLSTIHRVAGSFISGAGLLILFPLLVKDAFPLVIKDILDNPVNYINKIPLLIAILCTYVLPIIAIYLLLRDIVLFYYTGHIPGYPLPYFIPRFALTSLSLPIEEENDYKVKEDIKKLQYEEDIIDFVIPKSQKKSLKYYKEIYDKYHDAVIPTSRINDFMKFEDAKYLRRDCFIIALGLSGFEDRDLNHSAAKMEASLVRHLLYLRRIVLRYAKALILIIVTLLIAIIAHQLNESIFDCKMKIISISILFAISGFGFTILVKLPVKWIYSIIDRNKDPQFVDPQLITFENTSWWVGLTICILGILSSILCSI